MQKIIILTSDALRHTFMRKALALDENIKVLKSYCEKQSAIFKASFKDEFQSRHLQARDQSEKDFFESFVELSPDYSNPCYIEKNAINTQEKFDEILALKPDLLVAYGCSILKPHLIKAFRDRILNVHLGLSPYYRGSGTNFFPFVNGELEYIGATFMYMDEGIDTGDIIHQIQAEIYPNDDMHKIGNRLIARIAKVYRGIIKEFENLEKLEQPKDKKSGKLYRNSDFTPLATKKAYDNLANSLQDYFSQKRQVKILQNPSLKDLL
ncbi:formyl transferase [Helicobacter turcicus]|uniref:phosphoribosylglycinamide formyltransferase 1 n=1 Tax=Helicobacter turcicus TaxID=2867412 RepID=A0ABS7JQ44_9HELI|nr:formyl transferase [Helicobacter turcicus]MBX7491518.1 formyl transferase [Helicobacter turcicus]MBX7546374.1 formyl transferase [Helicobacter turcicus]